MSSKLNFTYFRTLPIRTTPNISPNWTGESGAYGPAPIAQPGKLMCFALIIIPFHIFYI